MKKLTAYIKNYRGFLFVYIPTVFVLFLFLFMLLRFPKEASKGVGEGLKLCTQVLVPTLFPFIVGSTFLVLSGVMLRKTVLYEKLSRLLFKGSFPAVPVFILSFLGGYPVGGKLISDLYKKGAISREEGRRMLLFCINPSLSFTLSFLGSGLLKSTKAGLIIFISIILSSFLTGVVLGFLKSDNPEKSFSYVTESDLSLPSAFTKSVKEGAVTMGYICAFVAFFSAVGELVTVLPFSENVRLFLRCNLEVTNGCRYAVNTCSLPFITFIVSFGGISTLFQIMSYIQDLALNVKKYITVRLITSVLSSVVSFILFKIFPVYTETFSSGTISEIPITSYSAPVSAGLVLMTVLLILGDGFVLSGKDLDIKGKGR